MKKKLNPKGPFYGKRRRRSVDSRGRKKRVRSKSRNRNAAGGRGEAMQFAKIQVTLTFCVNWKKR